MYPDTINLTIFRLDEVKALLKNVQDALKEQIIATGGLQPYEIPLTTRLSITRLKEQVIAYQQEIDRRGNGGETVKILFLAASPDNLTRLSLDKEIRGIQERLRSGQYRDRFELITESAVRVRDITEHLLRHRPTIVHFSGHGDKEGKLQFHNDRDQTQGVPIAAFADLFERFRSDVRCVVLNSCYSETLAKTMAQKIDCVVGMTTAIRDDAAIVFAEDFYRALSFGQSLQAAFKLACIAIHLHDKGQQGVPQLYTSPDVQPEKLVLAG
jgi:hypothetical protein